MEIKFKCPICGSDSCSCLSTSDDDDYSYGDDDYKRKVNSLFKGRKKIARNVLFNNKFRTKFKSA